MGCSSLEQTLRTQIQPRPKVRMIANSCVKQRTP
jgi:hypothetical protein